MDWYIEAQQCGQTLRGTMTLRCNLESKHWWDVRDWRDLVYQTHYLRMAEVLLVDVWWWGPFECETGYALRLAPWVPYADGYRFYRLQRIGLRGHAWLGPYIRDFWHLDFFGAIWCWI
jgi:hypothetical protein